MKQLTKGLAGVIAAGVLTLFCLATYLRISLPDEYMLVNGDELTVPSHFVVGADVSFDRSGLNGNELYTVGLKLLDSIPIKNVQVQLVEPRMVIPGGTPFGIKMFTEGVMIVGMSDIQLGTETVNPSKEAGLKIGDILLSMDNKPVARNDDIKNIILESEGNEVQMTIRRDGEDLDFYLQPVQSEYDNAYKAGIWVRDSSAGIGTMTYYNPETLYFGGLGHAVCDVDTGRIMPLSSGEIVDVNISGSSIGESGKPGELKGKFVNDISSGKLLVNTEFGVFGTLEAPIIQANAIPIAYKQEIKPGPAVILSTVSGDKPQQFDIVIERVNYSDTSDTKNMIVRVTDKRLLETTGGIVQGMSGSPIIQNGKLIGAVTHVFVNDPARGYSIFAENMDKQLKLVENHRNIANEN